SPQKRIRAGGSLSPSALTSVVCGHHRPHGPRPSTARRLAPVAAFHALQPPLATATTHTRSGVTFSLSSYHDISIEQQQGAAGAGRRRARRRQEPALRPGQRASSEAPEPGPTSRASSEALL